MTDVKGLFDLSGKVALVTGGSRGLGQEMAEGLGEAGASLMIVARREQWLGPTLEELKAKGFPCEGMICDVSNAVEVQNVVNKTLETYGQIDILVNNAGVTWGAPAEEMPLDKWEMVIDINLTGVFLFSQAAGRTMIDRKYGRIINVSSVSGIIGSLPDGTHTSAYVAAKGGLIALTRELAAKWAHYGIRVNAIAPGFFPSRMTDKILEQQRKQMEQTIPMGRVGRAGELKGVAVFLAAPASDYMTGQTIVVDGGMTIV